MAIKFHAGDRITGLSTDAKPMFVPANSIFYATDTNDTYDFDGSSWTLRAVGLSATDNITVDGKTQSLADWVIMQKTLPAVATNLTAVADGKTTATVSYDVIDTDKVSAVKVEYSTDNSSWTTATTTANDTSYQVTGLTQDTDYYFRIYPSNIMGETGVTTLGSTINTWIAPTVPASLVATNDGNNTGIAVSWSASTSETPTPITAITYTVERSLDGSSNWSVLTTGLSAVSYIDNTNVIGTRYYYRCKSTNSADTSAYSNVDDHLVPINPVTGYGNAIKNPNGKLSGYDTYKFITSGNSSFTIDDTATVRVLVVGAGGSGGGTQGAGGNGGSVAWTDEYSLSAGTYTVTVGASSGGNSAFDGTTANGNGGGSSLKSGLTGDTFGMGSKGGNGCYAGGGGGGAQPQNGTSGCGGGHGGDGAVVTGMEYTDQRYGGGGGGGGQAGTHAGGDGGGGNGGSDNYACGSVGTDGTGGGGGGNCSRAGGTGAVMIRVEM